MERYTTIDAITGDIIPYDSARRVLMDYNNGCYIWGYVSKQTFAKEGLFIPLNGKISGYGYSKNFQDRLIFSKALGKHILNLGISKQELVYHKYVLCSGYPYSFYKEYEAVKNFKVFDGKQVVREPIIDFPIQNFLKYTFGLEFETSIGIIPENICFEDGLIPLRDGSITGNEYSTVVMEGQYGLNLLKQQLKDLRNFTRFDKECSLHIHLGGYPLNADKIFSLYRVCLGIERELEKILPRYTFKTSCYKKSGKDYCKILPRLTNFDQLYTYLTEKKFYGSFSEAHPKDIDRERKWNIHQRYHWVNLINMVCYGVNKTVEFRLLRPTYSLEKILFWLYVFNGVMVYAENGGTPTTLLHILSEVYPRDIYDVLEEEYYKVSFCTDAQQSVEDYIGSRIDIENEFFELDKIL